MNRRLKPQGKPFAFSPEALKKAQAAMAKYPEGRQASALKEVLYLVQDQCGGWIPQEAMEGVAELLDIPLMHVYEVVTFYTLFNLEPVGTYHLQVCTTTPCWLRGSGEILATCQKVTQDSKTGTFSVKEVECLGACANAPVVQINQEYYEDLTPETTEKLLKALGQGKKTKPGPQVSRLGSAPEGAFETTGEGGKS